MGAVMVSEVKDVKMTADRPFLFAIAAREGNVILFLGRVLDPTAG
jgi:serine protease inhibitor